MVDLRRWMHVTMCYTCTVIWLPHRKAFQNYSQGLDTSVKTDPTDVYSPSATHVPRHRSNLDLFSIMLMLYARESKFVTEMDDSGSDRKLYNYSMSRSLPSMLPYSPCLVLFRRSSLLLPSGFLKQSCASRRALGIR